MIKGAVSWFTNAPCSGSTQDTSSLDTTDTLTLPAVLFWPSTKYIIPWTPWLYPQCCFDPTQNTSSTGHLGLYLLHCFNPTQKTSYTGHPWLYPLYCFNPTQIHHPWTPMTLPAVLLFSSTKFLTASVCSGTMPTSCLVIQASACSVSRTNSWRSMHCSYRIRRSSHSSSRLFFSLSRTDSWTENGTCQEFPFFFFHLKSFHISDLRLLLQLSC